MKVREVPGQLLHQRRVGFFFFVVFILVIVKAA